MKRIDQPDAPSSFAINGGEPYIIHLFVGRVDPDNTVAYRDHPNRVGSVYTFSRPLAREGGGGSTCKNCQRQADANVLSCAQIPITGAMLKDSRDASNRGLRGFGEDDVEAYLKDLLSWKVVKVRERERVLLNGGWLSLSIGRLLLT